MNFHLWQTKWIIVGVLFVTSWFQGCSSLGLGQENPSTSKVRDMLELTQTSLQSTLDALKITQTAIEAMPAANLVQGSQAELGTDSGQTLPVVPTETLEPEQVESPPGQNPDKASLTVNPEDIIWYATHEHADISEWERHGGFVRQGPGIYQIVDTNAHSGQFSVGLTINTLERSETGAHAAYLFFWDQLPEDGYYYSAWYYIPSGTIPSDWWSIMQWKSTYDGNTDHSIPMFALDADNHDTGGIALRLFYLPHREDLKVIYSQDLKIPFDRWFQVEAYYKRSMGNNGQVIIWQDGQEIFNVGGVNTVDRDNTIYWSINSYADSIRPNPCTILVDDAVISRTRIGPDFKLTDLDK